MYEPRERVVITDIKMPFWSMVFFMVKWVIASIPAMIILTVLATAMTVFIIGFLDNSTPT